MFAVRQKLHTEDFVRLTCTISLGSEALSVSGLWQEFRVQRFAQETSQGARENRAAEDTMKDSTDLYLLLD